MVSSTLAGVLAVLSLILIAILASVIGRLVCLAFRLHWTMKSACIDAFVALGVAVISMCVLATIETARGTLESGFGLILIIAIGSPAVKYAITLVLQRR